jgi:hypothetical protein
VDSLSEFPMLGTISERSHQSSANMSIRLSEDLRKEALRVRSEKGVKIHTFDIHHYQLTAKPSKNVVQQVLRMKQNMGLHNLQVSHGVKRDLL